MYLDSDFEEDEAEAAASKLVRRKYVLGGIALAAVAAAAFVFLTPHNNAPAKPSRPPPIVMITPLPPPPPPPPKPEPKPAEPPKPLETKQTTLPPDKPKTAAPPKPVASNPAPKGAPLTAQPGVGGKNFGLQAGNGGGDTIGGGNGDGGGGGGGGYGFYAIKVQSQLQAALMRNDKTRRGNYTAAANLWLSGSGRIDRVEITQSSGDTDRDRTLAEVIRGQQISEAPPAGMPQPIRARIAARG
jgi:outer membrane biosynthesis protein TonB